MNLIVHVKSSKYRLKFLHSLADYLSINLILKVSFVKNFFFICFGYASIRDLKLG